MPAGDRPKRNRKPSARVLAAQTAEEDAAREVKEEAAARKARKAKRKRQATGTKASAAKRRKKTKAKAKAKRGGRQSAESKLLNVPAPELKDPWSVRNSNARSGWEYGDRPDDYDADTMVEYECGMALERDGFRADQKNCDLKHVKQAHYNAAVVHNAIKDFTLETESPSSFDPIVLPISHLPRQTVNKWKVKKRARELVRLFFPSQLYKGRCSMTLADLKQVRAGTVAHATHLRMSPSHPSFDESKEDDDDWNAKRFFMALRAGFRALGHEQIFVVNSNDMGPIAFLAQTDEGDLFGVWNEVVWT